MKKILMGVVMIFLVVLTACSKDKPTKPTTGGGDGSVTISGTVEAVTSKGVPVTIDGATLTITGPLTKKVYLSQAIGTTYSVKFGIDGSPVLGGVIMVFSRSGCNDDAKILDVSPNSNINVGGATLTCG